MGNRSSKKEDQVCLNKLPKEIIGEILVKLPPKDILRCRLVCKQWSEILSCLLYNNYNKSFKTQHTSNSLPFDLCYITLYGERFRRNLLKNVNGQEKFKYWAMPNVGENAFIVEDVPGDCNTLPERVEELNGQGSCVFATSRGPCVKQQRIHVATDKYLSRVINKYKPHIYASEWVAGSFNSHGFYQMSVNIFCKNEKVLKKTVMRMMPPEEIKWTKKEITINIYPDDVKEIIFEHLVIPTKSFRYNCGIKMTGAQVKLLLDEVKT